MYSGHTLVNSLGQPAGEYCYTSSTEHLTAADDFFSFHAPLQSVDLVDIPGHDTLRTPLIKKYIASARYDVQTFLEWS